MLRIRNLGTGEDLSEFGAYQKLENFNQDTIRQRNAPLGQTIGMEILTSKSGTESTDGMSRLFGDFLSLPF
ncbi:hypothetical protein DSAG12_02639 [Promethearchaeum syntrophicum]|uniref:Uncharacterized protein n=1 Tax=Promethearchaeum syntrophicum TaxID=2594042 RepID=A0A5B9DBZ6_9ARCH|nr:hypothetical protein [Candidatus Prometheoarchaeum syntrophicum]QEE16809.1 hypothetical protein DSAG12_02639 [Candidatus Prometheoarchaeum syntrophicum]